MLALGVSLSVRVSCEGIHLILKEDDVSVILVRDVSDRVSATDARRIFGVVGLELSVVLISKISALPGF